MIRPSKLPAEILGFDEEAIAEVLLAFGKSRLEWDEFVKKIDPVLRAKMAKVFEECRRNGFFGPHIGAQGRICFAQAVEMEQGTQEILQVEIDGEMKRVAREYIRPGMKIVAQIRRGRG